MRKQRNKTLDIKKMFPQYRPTTDKEFKAIAEAIKKLIAEEKNEAR